MRDFGSQGSDMSVNVLWDIALCSLVKVAREDMKSQWLSVCPNITSESRRI
jgi:hypothetical protein